jgi:hypothetical protein
MAKSFVLSRQVGDIGFIAKRADSLVDLATGQALDHQRTPWTSWITANTGVGKTLSALMKGVLTINDTGTDYELALMRPAALAMQVLD